MITEILFAPFFHVNSPKNRTKFEIVTIANASELKKLYWQPRGLEEKFEWLGL